MWRWARGFPTAEERARIRANRVERMLHEEPEMEMGER